MFRGFPWLKNEIAFIMIILELYNGRKKIFLQKSLFYHLVFGLPDH